MKNIECAMQAAEGFERQRVAQQQKKEWEAKEAALREQVKPRLALYELSGLRDTLPVSCDK